MHWLTVLNVVFYFIVAILAYGIGRLAGRPSNRWRCPYCVLKIESNNWGASQMMRAEHLQSVHPNYAQKTWP